MVDFDERSGIVSCPTDWGLWYQTLDEVSIELKVSTDMTSKDIHIDASTRTLKVILKGQTVIQGTLFGAIQGGNTLWTLEREKEGKLLRIVLQKSDRSSANTWCSLLEGKYQADVWLLDNMRKKAALERMQNENPGFDFSGAEITGNYATGGPDIPS